MEATRYHVQDTSGILTVELLDVVSILKSKLDIQALYCFGLRQIKSIQKSFIFPGFDNQQQNLHLDLLVLSTHVPSNATADLSDLIYKFTGGRYRVTLLLHSPAQVKAASYKNGVLFHNIHKYGWLLQTHTALIENPGLFTEHKLCVQHVEKFTANRLYNAQKLFELEDAVQGVEGGLLRASLLHTGVEQLCLAIIYAFMGYYPNHFHLQYLFSLCSHVTPIIEEHFPADTVEDKSLLKILHTTPQALRFKKSEQFTHTRLQVLEERCLNFYSEVEKLIEKRIAILEG
tara:strand:- start:7229 stop:8092 length:864 start_codon:yes stop_codon:yes gene_type:complete